MSRYAYVNGRYLPQDKAGVNIEDRGFQFADAVYEYFAVFDRKLADAKGHFDRLDRSLSALSMPQPMSRPALRMVIGQLLRLNRITDGAVYLQVSRGVAKRDHPFPDPAPLPTLVTRRPSLTESESHIGTIGYAEELCALTKVFPRNMPD